MHLDPEEAILAPVSAPAIATNPVFSSVKKQAMKSLEGMEEKSLGLLVIKGLFLFLYLLFNTKS